MFVNYFKPTLFSFSQPNSAQFAVLTRGVRQRDARKSFSTSSSSVNKMSALALDSSYARHLSQIVSDRSLTLPRRWKTIVFHAEGLWYGINRNDPRYSQPSFGPFC